MYRKIMAPMDGSELAECVIPHVQVLATGCQAETVVFVRVVEPIILPASAGDYMSPAIWTRIESEQQVLAENYVKDLATRVAIDGVDVRTEILEGSVAQSLVDYAAKSEIDLIVVATHGRSGISRWVWGSVAGRIIHSSTVPVLIVRSPRDEASDTKK
jgi:nucleotide-binding universal stress UspA family protein